jgi:Transcription factor WhiB
MTTSATRLRASQASDALTVALVDLGAQGLRPHCSDPGSSELWLSNLKTERAEAARLCIGCPVFHPCGEAAEARQETFGVWSGVDRTRPNVNHRHR